MDKIGLGGGCHWCTEAIFLSLKGVSKVEQGFIASVGKESDFSEAVIVHFDVTAIPLQTLVEVHLHTHKSTSNHSMRTKYRSAVYTYSEDQKEEAKQIIANLQADFKDMLITKVYPFNNFRHSEASFANYYYKNTDKPFCETYINPKLQLLMAEFPKEVNANKIEHLK